MKIGTIALSAIGLPAILVVIVLGRSGFLRAPRFRANFEMDAYRDGGPFIKPRTVRNGLAIYAVGKGKPILLFPYPHADTVAPMAQGPLSRILVSLGRQVISFDVPGAYRSVRTPRGDMAEMLQCALEALERCGIEGEIDVIGHSMGSLCALGFSIEQPQRVGRLVLVGSMSGFPAAVRWGMPGSCWHWTDGEYWKCMWWGIRLMFGRGDLALHKRLSNLMLYPCFFDKSFFTPVAIRPEDAEWGAPIRYLWLRNLGRKVDYSSRLDRVRSTTLICAGRYDPETPIACAQELSHGIRDSRIIVFEKSGHMPFIEEPDLFARSVASFLRD